MQINGKALNDKVTNLKGKVLYNNNSGSNGTVTLSESSANFDCLEIFFKEQSGVPEFSSTRVSSANGKRANLEISSTDSSASGVWIKLKTVSISGTAISSVFQAEGAVKGGTVSNSNFIYIVKIIGYK